MSTMASANAWAGVGRDYRITGFVGPAVSEITAASMVERAAHAIPMKPASLAPAWPVAAVLMAKRVALWEQARMIANAEKTAPLAAHAIRVGRAMAAATASVTVV